MQHSERFLLSARAGLVLLAWGASLSACGESAPKSAPEGGLPALSAECDSEARCKEGESCFERRCVTLCKNDGDCTTRELCVLEGSAAGLCVARDLPPPKDPCAGKLCAADACHPVTGACVACTQTEHCAGDTPVCDRGRGVCVAPSAVLCGACNTDSDCGESDAGAPLSCIVTDAPFERACLPGACDGDDDCPQGFACSPARAVCFPRRGSCTAYLSGMQGSTCSGPAQCSALGVAERSVHEGTCLAGRCALGCEQTSDCPGALVCSELACGEPDGVEGPDAAAPSSRSGEGGV